MKDRTTRTFLRTKNAAEAYRHRIGSVVQCAHPTLWAFLQKLTDEENGIHAPILPIKAAQTQKKDKN